MGFFSSRRAEQHETPFDNDNPVVRVIRSRFYGKAKGKERADVDADSLTPSPPSLSTSTFVTHAEQRSYTPGRPGAGSSLRNSHLASSVPSSPVRRTDAIGGMPQSRSSSDVITVTLAQRLNELATANSEGLLSDDEYRLLRQNLFERFASGSAVPAETPLVRMTGPGLSASDSRTSFNASHERHPSSQFYVQSSRTPSLSSKRSFTTTVTSLLRRATSKRVTSAPPEFSSDTISVYSTASTAPRGSISRPLSKRPSDSSIQSRVQQTNRRRELSAEDADPGRRSTARNRIRSSHSAPPSSFHGASVGLEPDIDSYTHISADLLPSDETVESVQDIRHQIELVEAEGRRLLDAFNGLELSTLTRRPRRPPVIPPLSLGNGEGIGVSPSFLEKPLLRAGKDVDSLSFKSNGSNLSMRRTSSARKMRNVTSSSTLVSQPGGVPRKGSVSSMSSRGRTTMASLAALASSSSVNLARSSGHLPLPTVEETVSQVKHRLHATESEMDHMSVRTPGWESKAGDEDLAAMEAELTDIRRRRVQVTARYEARLEYLRARLKGAELREKLLRK
ncbi:hypothetical protein B0H21DRAFT_508525 [Amylocystis lapponica]|nr:hypothetical protein B0H21DRAFT_508525 [Amylocystis lapponica]